MLLKTPSGRLTGGKEGKAEAAKSAYAPTSPQALLLNILFLSM